MADRNGCDGDSICTSIEEVVPITILLVTTRILVHARAFCRSLSCHRFDPDLLILGLKRESPVKRDHH